MQQYETSHAGPALVPRARWHGCQMCLTLPSAASAGLTPAADYLAFAQLALEQVMRECK